MKGAGGEAIVTLKEELGVLLKGRSEQHRGL